VTGTLALITPFSGGELVVFLLRTN